MSTSKDTGIPLGWNTIWFDGSYQQMTGLVVSDYDDFWRIQNGEKQPVVIVGGCHNGMYNVSILPGMKDKTGTSYFCYGYPGPVCFSWGLVIKPLWWCDCFNRMHWIWNGIARATRSALSGELESNFFWQIGMNGATNLAQAHSHAIQKFLAEEEIDQIEAFCYHQLGASR